ncbi:glycoside hydrolase family 28 protein [Microlunatus sp. GCM10028923]|uniref:rhamnogalacturonidase n=1 Tax=Microlunatus sp. GCM10028923 TaxID=3273400 RepID=UPI00361AF08C
MDNALSRRRMIIIGASAAAAGLLPGTAEAEPAAPATGPSRIFDVRRYGAKGDGVAIDSGAVNRAIDAAASPGPSGGPGGTVYVPAGTYACYSIRLRSKVALHLAPGATLLAAQPVDGRGYDPPEPGVGNDFQDFAHSHWRNSLIWGEGLTDVTVSGPGLIDGRGLVGGRGEEDPGAGNKAIALKRCRNVRISDLTILNGGSLAILPTGVDNLRIDNLIIDTYSDGINLDCCRNVRISGFSINTPNADAICLKSSYALDEARATENVTIGDCLVSGYDLGTLHDGTYRTVGRHQRIGRIKFGTESVGGFRNIAISNVIFEHCRGLALQTVDGGRLEDVTISNLTMRRVEMPIFLRLGARLSAPAGTEPGRLRRIAISDVIVDGADPRYPSTIAGIPGHPVEDVRLSNVRQRVTGGLGPGDVEQNPPEDGAGYPETDKFGPLPAYGFFLRHVDGITFDNVEVGFEEPDTRPAYVLRDVADADFHHSRPVADTRLDHVDHAEL